MTSKEKLIQRLKARLAAVRAEINAQIENGSAYTLSGSHSKTSISFEKLKAEETSLVRRLARLGGDRHHYGITAPGFGG